MTVRWASRLRSAVAGVAVIALGDTAGADTFLVVHSQLGDYVGMGEQFYFTEADTRFRVEHFPGIVSVFAESPPTGSSWYLLFRAPKGTEFAAGAYENASNSPSSLGAGIDVSGEGRGCNYATGRFNVIEAEFPASGDVIFAADFEQHCEGGGSALFGTIALNSRLKAPDRPRPPPPDDPATTYILLDSEPGEFIGRGRRYLLTSADGTLNFRHGFGSMVATFVTPLDTWGVYLGAPSGRPLSPGVYNGASGDSLGVEPLLFVLGNGSACSGGRGTFVVHEAAYGPGNEVAQMAADFEYYCGREPAALHGAVRVNSRLVPGHCNGDCDGNHAVSVDELITGVNVLLGQLGRDACPSLGGAGERVLGVDALVRAVNATLSGCLGPTAEPQVTTR